jgi:hypothetical protein
MIPNSKFSMIPVSRSPSTSATGAPGSWSKCNDRFYLSLPSRMLTTISCDVILAFIVDTSKGERADLSGTREKVLLSFLRINTFPVASAFSRTIASFWRASEYV